MGDCTSCPPSIEVDNLKAEYTELKTRMLKAEGDISTLKTTTTVSAQEIKQVFNILREIKDSIQLLADEVKTISMKPARSWDRLTATILVAVITAIVSSGATLLFAVVNK